MVYFWGDWRIISISLILLLVWGIDIRIMVLVVLFRLGSFILWVACCCVREEESC